MNRDEIVSRMSAITASGDVLSDEQISEYEGLEADLRRVNTTEQVMARQAAWMATQPVALPVAPEGQIERSGEDVAFDAYLRTGKANSDLQRAQGEGTAAAGGFLVPEGFRQTIIERLKAFGGVQGGSDSISTASGQPLPWPTNDDTSNLGAITAESASLPSGADLSFGTKMLGAYVYTSNGTGNAALKVPYELLQDSAFDLAGFIGRKLAERIARKLATDLVNGTGAGEPTGLLSTAGGIAQGTAWSSNTVPTYNDLVAMVHDVDPAYRENATWVFSDAVLKIIRQMKDSTNRPLLWDYGMNASASLTGLTLLGFPVIIDQACPAPASGNSFGFFGDLRQAFIVRTVKDVGLVTLMEKYAENRQVGYFAWGRFDSVVQNVNAGSLLHAA